MLLMETINLHSVLQFSWIAAIFPILLGSTAFHCLRPVHRLVSCFAGRGKTFVLSSKWAVPQSYFLHFYIIGVVWTSFLLACLLRYACGTVNPQESLGGSTTSGNLAEAADQEQQFASMTDDAGQAWISVFLLLLVELQVLRRLYESIYVFEYSSSAKMHVFAYFLGWFFYTAMPLSMASSFASKLWSYIGSQICENLVKGKEGMLPLEFRWRECMEYLVGLQWSQWIGATIFIWGWIHQFRCHQILGALRKGRAKNDYAIPSGDWFEFVSSPHYLAEIVLYGGIVVASGGSNPNIWLAFIFVVANLTFAAAETHRWYLQKFEDYPRSRCAILPPIY